MKKQFKYPLAVILLFIFCSNAWAQAPIINYNPSTVVTKLNVTLTTPITPVNTGGSVPATVYGTVSTFAGSTNGNSGSGNGTGTAARFDNPLGVAGDAAGNLYVADGSNHAVRKITSAGVVTTLTSSLNDPEGIALNGGVLYVSDYGSGKIVKVNTTTGAVTNFVNGLTGPAGICFDPSGNLYVADQDANQIKVVSPAGTVTVFAGAGGNGTLTNSTNKLLAKFNAPTDVQLDAAGNVFVADCYSGAIREISATGVTTFSNAFIEPGGLAMDAGGNLYVADFGGNEISQITPQGVVTLIAGATRSGTTDGVGTAARFNEPLDLYIDATGTAYIADQGNNSIRKLVLTGYTISPTTLIAGLTFNSTTGAITGKPTAATAITPYTITAYNASGSSSTILNLGCGQTIDWKGGNGNNGTQWERGQNWSTNSQPTSADDINIGVNVTPAKQPTITATTGSQTVNSITFGNRSASTITVTGTNVSLTANTAITLNNTSTATITGTGDLIMAPGSDITVNGTKLTISTSDFTLQSDATGSASIGQVTAANFITSGTTVHVERFMQGGPLAERSYRLMSSAVSNGTTTGKGKVYSINYLKTYSFLTGTQGTSGGFDNTNGGYNNPTLYLYRENFSGTYGSFTSGNYRGINNINNGNANPPTYTIDGDPGTFSIPVGNGFLFFFRGSRSTTNPFYTSSPPLSSTLVSTGTLNSGQIQVQLWFTAANNMNLSYTPTSIVAGYTLVGNPYPSSIDLNTYQTTSTSAGIYGSGLTGGTNGAFWVYDPVSKQYGVYNGVASAGFVSNIITSGQGFFVQANAANPKLIFNESAKVNSQNTGTQLLMASAHSLATATTTSAAQYIRLKLGNDSVNNEQTAIRFLNQSAPTDMSSYGAKHIIGNTSVNLSSISDSLTDLSINGVTYPMQQQSRAVRLNVNAYYNGSYQLELSSINNVPQLYSIWLIDAYKKDSVDLRKTSTYTVDINKADSASFGSKRLSIILRQDTAYAYRLLSFTANKVATARQVDVVWKTINEDNYTNFTVERSTDNGTTYTTLGGVEATGAGNYSFIDKTPVNGTNLYRLKQEDINNVITYSKIVTIQYSNLSNSIVGNLNVYPNPAMSIINLAISSQNNTPTIYNIRLMNSLGIMVKETTSSQPTWQGSISNLLPGTYILQVFDNKTQNLIGENKFVKL